MPYLGQNSPGPLPLFRRMGSQDIRSDADGRERAAFTRRLLEDVEALERMLRDGLFETGVQRIGAEQEMFLVDPGLAPAPIADAVLERAADTRLTTELARFNLEANLTPRRFKGACLHEMELELEDVVARTRAAALAEGGDVLLVGVLPTLRQSDARIENMSPRPRYAELNEAMLKDTGGRFDVRISGVDDLQATHDNVMLEACNTSFQLHYQVDPDDFSRCYNAAQAITAPVLAAAVNSPVFLRCRLWEETRIPLFERSVDDRSTAHQARGDRTRVHFGDGWMHDSVLELFRDNITRYRVLLYSQLDESPHDVLARGGAPELSALRLHNGTVYRWNRPCYGVAGGRAHLRIENRVLPAGPTILDEVANAALFFGLLAAFRRDGTRFDELMRFDVAKANFLAAARQGLRAPLTWTDGVTRPAAELLGQELLPIARQGLQDAGIAGDDVARYLEVIEGRITSRQTGARWILDSLAGMGTRGTTEQRLRAVVGSMAELQREGAPVHGWPLAEFDEETTDLRDSLKSVGQLMTTDLVTVRPGEVIHLAASVMNWRRVRHIPVEDDQGGLVGLLSYWALLEKLADSQQRNGDTVLVDSIMESDLVTVTPETPTLEAIHLMQRRGVSCLPVVSDGRLVGMFSERDLMRAGKKLLEDYLRG